MYNQPLGRQFVQFNNTCDKNYVDTRVADDILLLHVCDYCTAAILKCLCRYSLFIINKPGLSLYHAMQFHWNVKIPTSVSIVDIKLCALCFIGSRAKDEHNNNQVEGLSS